MQKTDNYELNLPEAEDFFNIEDFNDNTKKIDEVLAKSSFSLLMVRLI